MTAAFFDLDRTLLDCNSGHLWLRQEWRAGRLRAREIAAATWWFGRYALGHEDLEHAIHAAAAVYRGIREAEMVADVDAWFTREIVHRVRPGALAALTDHRRAGDACVLATSSSQFAAGCARRAWDFDDVLCTRVEVVDGVLTGALSALGFGRHKLDLCERWAAERQIALADCAFYTDSYSDLPLLEKVGRPVVVAPDRRLLRAARARGWPIVAWGCPP